MSKEFGVSETSKWSRKITSVGGCGRVPQTGRGSSGKGKHPTVEKVSAGKDRILRALECRSKLIAKFSSSGDVYSVVKAEFIAMRLAASCGLDVAPVSLVTASGKEVLLVERFDRILGKTGWQRRMMVSALTLLGLDEMMARYAGYAELAEILRHRFTDAPATLRELFSRIVFNILCGNTDDHARNHAAFWDGESLALTPAYDLCPQGRSGQEASQAMLITEHSRSSRIATCLEAAHHFLLSEDEALEIAAAQVRGVADNWAAVCDEASLAVVDRKLFWGRQFLNPYAFTGLGKKAAGLGRLSVRVRSAGFSL